MKLEKEKCQNVVSKMIFRRILIYIFMLRSCKCNIYIVKEVKNYSMNLLKIFMSSLLVSCFMRSSDDN